MTGSEKEILQMQSVEQSNNPSVDLVTKNFDAKEFLKEINENNQYKSLKPLGETCFIYKEFAGEQTIIRPCLAAIETGSFLDLPNARSTDAIKFPVVIGSSNDNVFITDKTMEDLYKQDFVVIDQAGNSILFAKKKNASSQSKTDGLLFFNDIIYAVSKSSNKQYIFKILNIFGKYFHQGGIGSLTNNCLSRLYQEQGSKIAREHGNNKVVFDLSGQEQDIIKIKEFFEFDEASLITDPEKIFKRADGKSIATFNFSYKIQVNTANDRAIVTVEPLNVCVIDPNLMKQIYQTSLIEKEKKNTVDLDYNLSEPPKSLLFSLSPSKKPTIKESLINNNQTKKN